MARKTTILLLHLDRRIVLGIQPGLVEHVIDFGLPRQSRVHPLPHEMYLFVTSHFSGYPGSNAEPGALPTSSDIPASLELHFAVMASGCQ